MFDDLRARLTALDGPWPTKDRPTRKRPAGKRPAATWAGPAAAPPPDDGGGAPDGPDDPGVPAYGLGGDGSLARDVGGYQAVLAIEDPLTVRLTYVGANGYPLPTVPGALKVPHAAEIRELKALAKGVRGTLADERARAEALMAEDGRSWRHGAWRREWLDHPVSGAVARGLIWEFQDSGGIWHAATPGERVLVTVDGRALPVPADGARVRLWHPARARPGVVRAWRDFVVDNRMVQAFKQAFREVCMLGPDEEGAARSDRFAGHIVRYARLRELFRERGWRPDHRGRLHGGAPAAARRVLGGGWRAVLRYDPAEAAGQGDRVVTGQVRFERRDRRHWSRARLADAPPLVFSEAMRDVGLFVDAASIAADPDWPDGEDRHHLHYRREAAFGRPGAAAEVRRAALERVLPRTKIADRCALDDRFLAVRGELRAYRIHLGTGHVRMEPDGTPLRIVPARRKGQSGLFLPFEDERLSSILTKASLLAADHKIADESLLRRIREGTG
ncbi:DUF4132 domain-containing protein [Actinomadura sp. LD22]|uniref:DUF4132 domain-containing protein n=1 Tax=Actinomadura physcomitrii TaxID=2650748 RepID=A0A6I4MHX8_9ACTN|nr:DUF4132 domain-containing protein [Actinomadura physcomitrii]MWA01816.1 DUF4132 domain-containing protein [Actinomadura physcomitrii]